MVGSMVKMKPEKMAQVIAGQELLIFDLDDTLARWKTGELLPGVYDWFEAKGDNYALAIASNQGGIGLRYWMSTNKFGNADEYPSEDDALDYLASVIERLPERFRNDLTYNAYLSFAYMSRQGEWGPVPEGQEDSPYWLPEMRKPRPGMLLLAMEAWGIPSGRTTMIGDRAEDEQAAAAAGCKYVHSDMFFRPELYTGSHTV